MKRQKITKEGMEKLRERLLKLEKEERPEVVKRLQIARSFGDLKENTEFSEARASLDHLDEQITDIKMVISCSVVIEKPTQTDFIEFCSLVTLENLATKEQVCYQIVADPESDFIQGKISEATPVAKNLLNKKVNDLIKIGENEFKIVSIS